MRPDKLYLIDIVEAVEAIAEFMPIMRPMSFIEITRPRVRFCKN